MPIVELRSVRKRFDEHVAVDGISLEIEAGECFGFLGPNGAGKTTTLRMLLGLTPPSEGEIEVLGFPVPARAREMRTRVGVVPQQDNLDPDFGVVENLLVYGRYFGIPRNVLERRAPELVAFASLEGREHAPIATLSGGMKRRLAIARSLVNDPEVLFLDEPTTGLDPQARHLIWQRLRGLRKQGKTLLLTTHYMEEAQRLCDRLVVLDAGRILDVGSPAELIHRHIEAQVVEVTGEDFERWHEDFGGSRCDRSEIVGESAFCYGEDVGELLESLANEPALKFVHRPASLEDVFLKLTGRELRD